MRKTLLGVLALVFSASASFAADTPEQVYKKLIDAWAKAKTIHFDGVKTSQSSKGMAGVTLDCNAWIGAENHLRMEITATVGGQAHKNEIVSDGENMVSLADGKERGRHAASKNLGDRARGLVLAGGFMLAGSMLSNPANASVSAADFKPTAEEKVGDHDAVVLEYTLVVSGEAPADHLSMKLYFDKTTLQILKRVATNEKHGLTITEEYGTIELDKDAPADAFKLPAPGPTKDQK